MAFPSASCPSHPSILSQDGTLVSTNLPLEEAIVKAKVDYVMRTFNIDLPTDVEKKGFEVWENGINYDGGLYNLVSNPQRDESIEAIFGSGFSKPDRASMEAEMIKAYCDLADTMKWNRYSNPTFEQIDLPNVVENIVVEYQKLQGLLDTMVTHHSTAIVAAYDSEWNGTDPKSVTDFIRYQANEIKRLGKIVSKTKASWSEASSRIHDELIEAGIDPYQPTSESVWSFSQDPDPPDDSDSLNEIGSPASASQEPPTFASVNERNVSADATVTSGMAQNVAGSTPATGTITSEFKTPLKDWEKWVSETATYFDCGGGDITYPLLGLVGELGELVNSIVKYYRKADLITLKIQDLPSDLRKKLKDESYDALHFLMFLLIEQGLSLEEIISYGREKLEKRMEDGTIHKENRVSDSIVGKRISIGEERSEVGIVITESTDVVTVITPFVNVVLHLAEIGVSQANLKIEVVGTASQEELDRIDGVDYMDKELYTVACPRENFYKALK